jgi:hypothetical protein
MRILRPLPVSYLTDKGFAEVGHVCATPVRIRAFEG